MTDLWMILAPILLADVLNPVLFAFLVFAAGTAQPVLTSSAALLGHTLAYLVVGVILALGLERISDLLANPSTLDFVVEFLIGLFIVGIAIWSSKSGGRNTETAPTCLSPLGALGTGAAINLVGLPFAVPYVGAISQILKVHLDPWAAFFTLLSYNLLYALPFTTVPLLVLAMGEQSRPILERINSFLTKIADKVLPTLIALVGLALIADALTFLLTGKPLIEF